MSRVFFRRAGAYPLYCTDSPGQAFSQQTVLLGDGGQRHPELAAIIPMQCIQRMLTSVALAHYIVSKEMRSRFSAPYREKDSGLLSAGSPSADQHDLCDEA